MVRSSPDDDVVEFANVNRVSCVGFSKKKIYSYSDPCRLAYAGVEYRYVCSRSLIVFEIKVLYNRILLRGLFTSALSPVK
jgi:hypothetical protein